MTTEELDSSADMLTDLVLSHIGYDLCMSNINVWWPGIRVATIVGGMADVKQVRMLRAGPEVVVATPGRLWELLQRHEHLQQMHAVKYVVVLYINTHIHICVYTSKHTK